MFGLDGKEENELGCARNEFEVPRSQPLGDFPASS